MVIIAFVSNSLIMNIRNNIWAANSRNLPLLITILSHFTYANNENILIIKVINVNKHMSKMTGLVLIYVLFGSWVPY